MDLERRGLSVEHLRQIVGEEVSVALKESDAYGQSLLRRAVREEVQRAADDRGLAEAALSRSLADGKWVSKIEASILQFLKRDFDKVLALGADAYHFRRWDELQVELRELRKSGTAEQTREVSHTRDLVGHVREKHDELSSQVTALRERLELASERLEAIEGHSANSHECFERQKAFHFKILEERCTEIREEILKETAKIAAGFRKDIDALQQDMQGLHQDRQWLHRQEEALSGRCRDLEKRVDESATWTKESHAATHAAAQDAKGHADELVKKIDKSHASLTKLYEEARERHALSEADLRKEVSEHKDSVKALLTDSIAQEQKQREAMRDALSEDLKAEQRSKHEALEANMRELVGQKTSTLGDELKRTHGENKVLREKLETAVVKGYQAVEAQFREALEQQVNALRAELAEVQAAQARYAERHEELRTGGVRADAALEQRMLEAVEALQKQLSQLRAAQETGDHRVMEDVQAQLQSLRDDLDAIAKGGQEAVQGVDERLREAQEALEGRHANMAERVAALDADKEALHRDLRGALEEGDKALEERLNQALAENIAGLSQAAHSQSHTAVSKEYAHKLHAMAYTLLEVIGEVQLVGSPAEAQGKRTTLHNRLCDRLGGRVLPPGEEAPQQRMPGDLAEAGKASRMGSSHSSTRPGTVPMRPGTAPTLHGKGPLPVLPAFGVEPSVSAESPSASPSSALPQKASVGSRGLQDTAMFLDFGEGTVSLPAVPRPPSQPSTPKPQRSPRFGDSLREIRNLRLVDVNSTNWGP